MVGAVGQAPDIGVGDGGPDHFGVLFGDCSDGLSLAPRGEFVAARERAVLKQGSALRWCRVQRRSLLEQRGLDIVFGKQNPPPDVIGDKPGQVMGSRPIHRKERPTASSRELASRSSATIFTPRTGDGSFSLLTGRAIGYHSWWYTQPYGTKNRTIERFGTSMDPQLTAIATAGGVAIVQTMATDAWSAAKSKILHFFRLKRVVDSDTIGGMDYRRDTLRLSACGEEVDLQVRDAERCRWSGVLEQVLDADPDSREELEELIADLADLSQSAEGAPRQYVSSGRDTYVAGRDQHIVVHNRRSGK